MQGKIRVIQVGLGAIGVEISKLLAERDQIEIASAVDADPEKAGQDLGTLSGMPEPSGVPISNDLGRALSQSGAQVAILTTVSSLPAIQPLVMDCIQAGLNVLSTCEELSYPWLTQPELSREIDQQAQHKGVSVLGTGINPGFLMDLLPIALTGVCRQVEQITVQRIQDAANRRLPFQRKIGAGLSPRQFEERVREGTLRHAGFTESMHMIAGRLGWTLDRTEDVVEPILAVERTQSGPLVIEAGQALGILQTGRGFQGKKEVLSLLFRAAIGQQDPADLIRITGSPSFEMVIPGGVHGDVGTCAITANAVPVVAAAAPGLRTMADVPVVSSLGFAPRRKDAKGSVL